MEEFTLEIEMEPLTEEQKNAIFGMPPGRPAPMKVAVPRYEYEHSKYPDSIRVSFLDGHTEIYDKRTYMPHPLVVKNIEIMEKTQKKIQGYVNQPMRRRRRNRT